MRYPSTMGRLCSLIILEVITVCFFQNQEPIVLQSLILIAWNSEHVFSTLSEGNGSSFKFTASLVLEIFKFFTLSNHYQCILKNTHVRAITGQMHKSAQNWLTDWFCERNYYFFGSLFEASSNRFCILWKCDNTGYSGPPN